MNEIALEKLLLSDVANTGLMAACCRAKDSRSADPILRDPAIEDVVARLVPVLQASPSALHRRLARGRFRSQLVVYFALRARKYDLLARDFLARHPDATVVNLGCGLDTRFARLDDGRMHLYDLDLPEMIALKHELLRETDRYHMIGRSVLDQEWRGLVAQERPGRFLFLAEGLFMYLPAEGVRALVADLADRFPGSEVVFETVHSTWLKPYLKWMIGLKMQRELGLGRGTEYRFGIGDAHEPEGWSPGIRFLEEWSYMDDDDPRLGMMRLMGRWPLIRRTQWTVRYALGGDGGDGDGDGGSAA